MDHNHAARPDFALARTIQVPSVGVGDMQRTIILAACIPVVDDVDALRGATVAFLELVPDRIRAEGDFVSAEYFAGFEQLQFALRLEDKHTIYSLGRRRMRPNGGRQDRRNNE